MRRIDSVYCKFVAVISLSYSGFLWCVRCFEGVWQSMYYVSRTPNECLAAEVALQFCAEAFASELYLLEARLEPGFLEQSALPSSSVHVNTCEGADLLTRRFEKSNLIFLVISEISQL